MPSPKSPPIFQIFVAGKTFLCSPTSTHYENIRAKTQAEKGQALCSRSHRGWVAEPVLNPAREAMSGWVTLASPALGDILTNTSLAGCSSDFPIYDTTPGSWLSIQLCCHSEVGVNAGELCVPQA